MIIPIGLEENTVRRQPWVTFSLMALCVGVFFFTNGPFQNRENEQTERLTEAVRYYVDHAYLELDPRLRNGLIAGSRDGGRSLVEIENRVAASRPRDLDVVAQEQKELDRLTEEGFAVLREDPSLRWGLVPAQRAPVTLIT